MRGAPVEEAVSLSVGLEDIVVGRVEAARLHPGADRLTLCTVSAGGGEVSVVCGAPDVKVGACYPFAPAGAVLPGGFKIGRRKIRGEYSEGMLCSEKELELGTDHAGIMLLEGDFEPGAAFARVMGLDDVRFDVEVTPNRGDLLSHAGIARELHPRGHAAIVAPPFPGGQQGTMDAAFVRGAREAAAGGVRIAIEEPEICSRYLGAVIRGVRVRRSPDWLANRLRAAGARPVNNVVDATNYVMLELGHPLHAFDLAKLADLQVSVGCARPGESIVTLDGETRALAPDMLAIRDAEGPVAVAGVMGGANSEVSAATTDLLLECALFEPRQVRAARRSLGMSTDASYRFERGVDPEAMESALLRAAFLITEVAGGSLDGPVIDVCPVAWKAPVVALRPSRVRQVLGVDFGPDEIAGLLAPLGYEAAGEGRFRVPGYRSYDTLREIDLVEEVARTHGYDAFPEDLGPCRLGTVPDHPLFSLEDALRATLVSDGISEAQTPPLCPEANGDVPVLNPMSAQESRLRRDLLSGLLAHVERNMARGVADVRLFELGTAFAPAPPSAADPVPAETARVAVVLAGRRSPLHWSVPDEPFAVYDAARVLKLIAREAYPNARVVPVEAESEAAGQPANHPGAAAAGLVPDRRYELIDEDGAVVGAGGEVRPERTDLPPWAGVVVGAEVVLPAEPAPRAEVLSKELPEQPASTRDIAMLVPSTTPAGAVLASMRSAGGALLEEARIFDVYEGADLPDGMRSVAFRLRFRARDRTLTEAEIERALRRVTRKVRQDTGVEPRG